MINFNAKVVNKNMNKKGAKAQPCGIPANTENQEENFPTRRKKEDLVGK
jgi:hypothetical protein